MKILKVKIIISKTQDIFVGHAETSSGYVIASVLPREKEKDLLNKLYDILNIRRKKNSFIISLEVYDDFEMNDVTNMLIHGIFTGNKDAWEKSLKIKIGYILVSEKEKKVLQAVRNIPWGKVASYRDIAKIAQLPRAARFVGSVMANNPLAPLIPCHRVVKSNRQLGNYGLGSAIKKELLIKESVKLTCLNKPEMRSAYDCIISEKSFI